MLFHKHDRSLKRLAGCWKRAESFAREGAIDNAHALAPSWSNCKMFLDAADDNSVESIAYDISLLDWFALKLDEYSKENMLADDATVAAMLHEWKQRMNFNPVIMARGLHEQH